MKHSTPLAKRIALSAVALVLGLLFLEVALRLLGFLPALPLDPDAISPNGYFWISDPVLGFRNRPHGRYVYRDIRSMPVSTTDRFGFRNGYGWHPDTASPAVVMVGDSVVFCAEVEDQETLTSALARRMEAAGSAPAVLNAGVRGYNTVQAKRMLAECLDRYASLRVAIYSYCDNDWFENIRPKEYWPAQAPTVTYDAEVGAFLAVEVTEPTVPWGESFLPAVAERRVERRRRLTHKRLDRRVRDWLRERIVLFHLVQNAVASRGRGAGRVSPLGSGAAPRDYPELDYGGRAMVHLLREMQALCDRHGVALLVTEMRTGEVRSRIHEWCATAGVEFVDPSDTFQGPARQYLAPLREGGYDPHLSAHGAEVFAKALFPAVERELRTGETDSEHRTSNIER